MNNQKKKYVKPIIKKVKLFTDEAVLTGCKTVPTDASGKGTKTCSAPGCKSTYAS